MQIKFSSKGTTLIVYLTGELDQHSADYIRQKVDSEVLKSSTRNLVLDFSKVGFMDSSGIGVIMGRYKNMQKLNGKTAILSAGPQVKRIFEMSGLLKFLPLYDKLEDAVGSF